MQKAGRHRAHLNSVQTGNPELKPPNSKSICFWVVVWDLMIPIWAGAKWARLRHIVCIRLQVLFHSPSRGSFHLSLAVLVHYRLPRSI